jgi:tripartite-type tricarboxylate transporter receptor subunit TctC
MGHVAAGRVKAFGTTGSKRESGLPQLATIAELGTPDFSASNWFALFGPKGIDSVITNKLNKGINDSLIDPELQRRFEAGGNTPLMGSSTDLANLVQQESAMYRKLINDTGIRID